VPGPDGRIDKLVDSLQSFPEDNNLRFIHIKFHLNINDIVTSSISCLATVASILCLPKFSLVDTIFVSIHGKVVISDPPAIPMLELVRSFEEHIDHAFAGWKSKVDSNSLRREVQLLTIQQWIEELDTYKLGKIWECM
jgi:hypothetical protein